MGTPAAVIQAGPPASGAGGIPGGWRTVVIAGGALAALVAVVLQTSRKSGGSDGSDNNLSTAANVALGQVAYEQRKAAGEESARDAALMRALDTGLTGQNIYLGNLIGEAAMSTSAQLQAQNEYLTSHFHATNQLIGQTGVDIGDTITRSDHWVWLTLHDFLQRFNALAAPPPYQTVATPAEGGGLENEDVEAEPDVQPVS